MHPSTLNCFYWFIWICGKVGFFLLRFFIQERSELGFGACRTAEMYMKRNILSIHNLTGPNSALQQILSERGGDVRMWNYTMNKNMPFGISQRMWCDHNFKKHTRKKYSRTYSLLLTLTITRPLSSTVEKHGLSPTWNQTCGWSVLFHVSYSLVKLTRI